MPSQRESRSGPPNEVRFEFCTVCWGFIHADLCSYGCPLDNTTHHNTKDSARYVIASKERR